MMGKLRFAAILAFRLVDGLQSKMGPTHITTRLGCFSFWYGHVSNSSIYGNGFG